MQLIYRWLLVGGLLLTICLPGQAQKAPAAHRVYLLGNTAGPVPEARLRALRRTLEQETTPFTVVHLGDIVGNEGLAGKQDTTRAALEARADALVGLVKGLPNGRIYFVPGDKDWDNSGRNGQKAVRRLEKYIEKQLDGQDAFIPSNGCPGPEIVDVAPLVRLVALNTPWWSHPYDRPEVPDTDCKTMSAEEFREQLQDVLEKTKGRNVLLVGHQPVVSNGPYGGFQPLKRHLSPPVLGTVYAAYRQNVGTPRDMASPGYQAFKKQLLGTLKDHPGALYVAAHDFSLQLTPFERSYHLVTGSFARTEPVANNARSLYNKAAPGYTRLDYFADGTVKAAIVTFDEQAAPNVHEAFAATLFQSACLPPNPQVPTNSYLPECPGAVNEVAVKADAVQGPIVTVTPGPQYRAHGLQKPFIGPAYRTSWTQPVQVPVLDLSTEKGGLRPTRPGGGRQTTSLKMIAADSSEYTFRSVDKDVTRILPPELRNSVAADILRDITPTAHPYSALVIAPLLDRTDILHARPRLFVLPDNQQLGPFRQEYAGLLGTLEDDPWDAKPNLPGFAGADNVRRSFSMFRQLYKDHDNRVDAMQLGKARAFDMLIADFGKHEDNWKWAEFKDGKSKVFQPIPRDRDQSFTQWNGALTWIANREWAVPSIEDFGEKFDDLKSLNWPARHLDRSLLQSLNRDDWRRIGQYLQQRLTPAAIDSATAQLPTEIQELSGQEINRKLKRRIQQLPQALDEYYLLLARDVDVVGSNKAEHFEVTRLPDGNVRVQVSQKDKGDGGARGEPFFDRTFVRGETHDIRLYGLDGKDRFRVTGEAPRSIRVRIIGGEGGDQVADNARGGRTEVYDVAKTELQAGPATADRRSEHLGINRYDREAFEYDSYAPRAGLSFNRNDGFGVSAGFDWVKQGFRKPDFRVRYGLDARYTTGGNRQLTGNVRWRHVFGKWDLGALASYGNFFPFYNFFGLGNNTGKNDDLFDNNFYRARYRGYQTEAFIERAFRQKSVFRVGPVYEEYASNFARNSYLGQLTASEQPAANDPIPNISYQRLLGGRAVLDVDFRDRKQFARKGVRLYGEHSSYQQLNLNRNRFGLTEGFAEYYATTRLGIPVTLVVKGGGAKNHGDTDDIPFYKFTQLGQRQNLRGYVRNRFTGDASVYLNTELRLALGYAQTSFLPFYYGVFGFYDQGRVYFRGDSPGGWRRGYGGGFYLAPVYETVALSVALQSSAEEKLLLQFGLGFRIDQ